jgi:hypothetical protein
MNIPCMKWFLLNPDMFKHISVHISFHAMNNSVVTLTTFYTFLQ